MCVSLGTRTMAQVAGHASCVELQRSFWKEKSGKKVYRATFSEDLTRRVLGDVFHRELPRECTIDVINCTNFHGVLQGHVGLHPTFQEEYLCHASNQRALRILAEELCTCRGFPLQYQHTNANLQRVFVFYCNAGVHRSVAMASLTGDMMRRVYGAEVGLIQFSSGIS